MRECIGLATTGFFQYNNVTDDCWCGASACQTFVAATNVAQYVYSGAVCSDLGPLPTCSGEATGIQMVAKAVPHSGRVKQGGMVKYQLRVRNKPAVEGVGVSVVLPQNTTYVKGKAVPRKGGLSSAVVDGQTVTWAEVPMPAKRIRTFTIYARVDQDAPVDAPLVFSGYVFQTASASVPTPFCPTYAGEVGVLVKAGK